MKITITKNEYIKLKALFIACSKDRTIRVSLTGIYYDSKKNQFIATDGHILRVENLESEALKKDFLIFPENIPHTKSTLKNMPNEIYVDIPDDNLKNNKYPEYERVIPKEFESKGITNIRLDLTLLDRLNKSIVWENKITAIEFKFHTNNLSPVGIFIMYPESKFIGIIMPLRNISN